MSKFLELRSYELVLINSLLLPSQGLLNKLIYARKDLSKYMLKTYRRLTFMFSLTFLLPPPRSEAQAVSVLSNLDSLSSDDECTSANWPRTR